MSSLATAYDALAAALSCLEAPVPRAQPVVKSVNLCCHAMIHIVAIVIMRTSGNHLPLACNWFAGVLVPSVALSATTWYLCLRLRCVGTVLGDRVTVWSTRSF
jgi:hypothetical protein